MSSKHYSNGLRSWLSIINTALTTRSEMDEQIVSVVREAPPEWIAESLKTYQMWRRGEPPYDGDNCQPYSSKELNAIIDRAIELLKEKE